MRIRPESAWKTETSLEAVARRRLGSDYRGLIAIAAECELGRVMAIFKNGTCQREEREEISRLLGIPERMVIVLLTLRQPRRGASLP